MLTRQIVFSFLIVASINFQGKRAFHFLNSTLPIKDKISGYRTISINSTLIFPSVNDSLKSRFLEAYGVILKDDQNFRNQKKDLLRIDVTQNGGGYGDYYETWFFNKNLELRYLKAESWSEGGYGDSTFVVFKDDLAVNICFMEMNQSDYKLEISSSSINETLVASWEEPPTSLNLGKTDISTFGDDQFSVDSKKLGSFDIKRSFIKNKIGIGDFRNDGEKFKYEIVMDTVDLQHIEKRHISFDAELLPIMKSLLNED